MEASERLPVETTEKVEQDYKSKPVNLQDLSVAQRTLLRGGLKNALMDHPAFKVLGAQHKIIFYDTCNMIVNPVSLLMLDIKGEEYWKTIDIPEKKKKEKVRMIKFEFKYVIPGSTNSLNVVKDWRYEDFGP
jgi:hypothetical protein